MKIFLIVTSIILAVIIGLTLISIGFLLNESAQRKVKFSILLLDLLLILIFIIGFTNRLLFSDTMIEIFGNIMTVIFTSQIICATIVIIAVIIRRIYRLFNKPTPFSRQRRKMLAYGLFYPIYSLAAATYGNQIERNDTVDNFYDIPINNLPTELEGFKIAQISDIHLGAFYSLDKLKNLLTRIVDSKPDVLAITGDIFDSVEMNDEAIKLVDSFCEKFKYGIWYCHGNHEHHRGIYAIEKALQQTKIHWLVNKSEALHQNSKLYFIGVDYPTHSPVMQSKNEHEQQEFQKHKHEFMTKAMTGVPNDAVCVLLAHHPEFIDDAIEFKIPLTLTGHTHGSQIGIFGVPLFPIFKYTRGMVISDQCYGYVHVGNGSWFPFRLGCPPEIAYFTLKNRQV